MTYSSAIRKAAICGDGIIRVCDANNWKTATGNVIFVHISLADLFLLWYTDTFTIGEEAGKCLKLAWTSDGQILTVSTQNGYIFNYLTRLPPVHATCQTRYALKHSFDF